MYNRTYGSYGGYSGYGGTSSYGSYGSYGGSGINSHNSTSLNRQNQNTDENNNTANNSRKKVMGQYFKMLGGLRSMLQMGFAMVALGRFTTQSWQLLKKIINFLMITSSKLFDKLKGIFPYMNKIIQKVNFGRNVSESHRTFGDKVYLGIRILASICLKIKNDLKKQVEEEHQLILLKCKQQQLLDQQQNNQVIRQNQGYI